MKKFSLLISLLALCFGLFAQDVVFWRFSAKNIENETIELVMTATVEDEWYIYSLSPGEGPMPTIFSFVQSDEYELIEDVFEQKAPKEKFDEGFGLYVKVFENSAVFVQKIKRKTKKPFTVQGLVSYQSCSGMACMMFESEVMVTIPEVLESSQDVNNRQVKADTPKQDQTTMIIPEPAYLEHQNADSEIVEVTPISGKLSRESILGFILAAIFAGLACILTPCVFPMIPMTVGFFVSGSKNKVQTVGKAVIFWLSVGFVYGLVGCIISIFKSDSFAQMISTHWIPNLLFFLMFILFSASFFGMFEIILPTGMANKADKQVDKGGYIASFFMAIVLAIVSFSCTGPFVGSLISEAVKGSAVMKPIFGFVCFGLAMGAPFLLFAIFPSVMKKLPKSGGWLNAVKVVFAFIMLGFSLKFIVQVDDFFGWNLISREVGVGSWVVLSFLMGMYLLDKIKFSHDSDVPCLSVPRLFLAIITFSFGIYLIPGLFGADLEAVSAFLPAKEKQAFDLYSSLGATRSVSGFSGALTPDGSTPKYAGIEPRMSLPDNIQGFYDLNEAKVYAQKVNKPILLDFTGIFCSNCKKMKASAFKDFRVVELINKEFVFVALYTDVKTVPLPTQEVTASRQGKPIKTIGELNAEYQLQTFDVRSQPYFAVIDYKENVLVKDLGYADADELLSFLHRGLITFDK